MTGSISEKILRFAQDDRLGPGRPEQAKNSNHTLKQNTAMKTIRHLITIVFLLCGLTALGSERGYDRNDLDRYVVKELEILDKNNLFWGYHLQEGYEKRVELYRYAPKESSPKRKAQKEVWKDLIEQVVQEVVG